MTAGADRLVRTLRADELQALLALYPHLHGGAEEPPSLAQAQASWDEAMANPRCRYFGAFADGQLVSSCTLMVIPNLTRGCRPYGVIENVVTHAAHRQQGWGRAVLDAALCHAWSEGCYKVMLMTGRRDDATLRFYANAGFSGSDKTAFVARPPANEHCA